MPARPFFARRPELSPRYGVDCADRRTARRCARRGSFFNTDRELRLVYSVFYIIGVVVVVLMVLSFLGIH